MEGFWTWRLVLGFKKPDSPSSSKEENPAGLEAEVESGCTNEIFWLFHTLGDSCRAFGISASSKTHQVHDHACAHIGDACCPEVWSGSLSQGAPVGEPHHFLLGSNRDS